MTTSVTGELVAFATALRAQDIPESIQHKVSLHLLDALACGWAACDSPVMQPILAAAKLSGGSGGSFVFGQADGFSPLAAAFANASLINGLDHDDGVEIDGKGLGHPGATLVAAALAALDLRESPIAGAELITALTVGFEVNNRLIQAIQPSVARFNQVYGVAQHQSIGAALVAGLLLDLDAERLHHAVGLAAALTPLPSLHKYNWQQRPLLALKDAVAPAAQAGVQAAIMAHCCITGSRDVLDGEQGFWRMIGSDCFRPEVLTTELGKHWYAGYGSFKRYPACRWLACALESMDDVMAQTGWQAGEIERIEVQTFPRLVDDMMDRTPRNATDAQFSLPWTLAAVALRLPPGAEWYSPQTRGSAQMSALVAKVTAQIDEEFTGRMCGPARQPGARVIVHHRGGASVQQERYTPLGSADRPLDEAEIIAKARRNIAGHLPPSTALIEVLTDVAALSATRFDSARQLAGGQR
ncbi:MmgE/PrpD family protein [Erwinia sp. INIA-01]|uniref:MmgE/PrpD family protein n=1 Tax=Erwinia sp. INIA01 TaxID=2991500 RepID=UPI002224B7EB|nr:MmgE/PrpD family protein [Erwinia sp. INIA01]MCW1874206.1 MmgE/PrpD family protein [Erwinia sp. INIA01]